MKKVKEKKSEAQKKKLESKRLELFVFVLFTVIVVLLLWPFFTTTIEGGYVGAYYSRFFGGTLVDKSCREGIHLVFPWDKIIPYDARTQSKDYQITALTKGGLSVNVDMSVLWAIKPEKIGTLHKEMGPEYATKIIDPAIVSSVRSVIGSYEQSLLYAGNPIQLQEDVLKLLNETLSDSPFTLHVILVRQVKLPSDMAQAISDKFIAEQNVLTERYRVLESVERFKRDYVDAEATSLSQSIINEGMSEAYLRYLGIQATKDLAASPNAKLVIVGDKDGLPLMLNPDTLTQSETLPDGTDINEYSQKKLEQSEPPIHATYTRILEMLDKIDTVSEDLINHFPEADEDIGNSLIPQENKVPGAVIPSPGREED